MDDGDGLRVVGRESFTCRVRAATDIGEVPGETLVLLTTKVNDNRSAAQNNAYSSGTGAPEWTTNVGRISGLYHAPLDIQVAANYTIQVGRWSGPIFTRIAAADPQFGPSTVTLSNGRLVSNPLATTLRFDST